MEELHSAIAGLSDDYILADHASYLQVPADIWFEWTPKMRETYVLGVQKLSLQDVYNQKDVLWLELETIDIDAEFRHLGDDIVTELVQVLQVQGPRMEQCRSLFTGIMQLVFVEGISMIKSASTP